ncbi:MAG: biotin--[acetyl-CoA-carboxylase] ligase [Thaumarchaeota archaeon]|nr:biotin--[acetyl-CoA-carboxylase] ligase [Nitrososphaerota archaeon]
MKKFLSEYSFTRLKKIHPVILESVDSTQTFLQNKLGAKEQGDLVISRIQTRGRGREGRSWISDEGGLWMTLLLRPLKPEILGSLPSVGTESIAKTLGQFGLTTCIIKPPNDVYCSGKKIAGVLVDGAIQEQESIAYVGIGINLNNDPSKNKLISDIATSYVAETGSQLDLMKFTFSLLVNLDSSYDNVVLTCG